MIKEGSLSNGIKIVSEKIPHLRSISLGVWIKSGSRNEEKDHNGVYHFIEHMLFKGSKKYKAIDIAKITDSIGGNLDAFTSKEFLSVNFHVHDENFSKAFDVLSELILNPTFPLNELERERQVILEEIKSVEDSPDELILDLFLDSYWKDHPLGRSILGSKETVSSIKRKDLIECYFYSFTPSNIVFSASGNLEHNEIFEKIEKNFSSLKNANPRIQNPSPPLDFPGIYCKNKKQLQQVHFIIGMRALPQPHPERYSLFILNDILGGGMSSRLFQKIREKKGLVYNIFSFVSTFIDTGFFGIYGATDKRNIPEVVKIIDEELVKIKEGKIKEEELARSKDHLKGSVVLNLESAVSRMAQIARNEIYFKKQISLEEILKSIDSVNLDDLKRVSKEIINSKNSGTFLLGNINSYELKYKFNF
ncbi:MAG: pitrilysin family protein [Acidobacteriota bacterium]